jgi:6-phosphogluconolactonase
MTEASGMKVEVMDTAEAVAKRAADIIAEEARVAVAARQRFVMAVSGGHTPWVMLRALATLNVQWQAVDIVQVDEPLAPRDDPDRNLKHLRESLLEAPLSAARIHEMPVESADLKAGAAAYAATLQQLLGASPLLDLVHLGLGPDGHTASLVPGDPVLAVEDADVAVTMPYQGRRRMTLTYPVLNRSRRILWVVTGSEKAAALRQLINGEPATPAGRVRRDGAVVVADNAAAAKLAS